MTQKSRSKEPKNPAIREALAVHEALRKLQFTPDEIFVRWSPEELHVVLKAQEKTFGIYVGVSDLAEEEFRAQWRDAVAWWNTGNPKKLQRLWDSSHTAKNRMALTAALVDYGFVFRNVDIEVN